MTRKELNRQTLKRKVSLSYKGNNNEDEERLNEEEILKAVADVLIVSDADNYYQILAALRKMVALIE